MAEPENVWVQIIRHKYLRRDNILEYKKKGDASWQWAKLSTLIDKFKTGLIWSVGSGNDIKFWTDNWITTSPIQARNDCPTIDNIHDKVSDYILGGKWWEEKLSAALPHSIVSEITNIPLPTSRFED